MNEGARPAKVLTPPGGTLGWVGPYQLVERLPYQGGAIEYLARQRGPFGFERNCRLKLVPSANSTGDQRAAEAVAREAKVVLRLDHPNIVRFYDLLEHRSNLVLVMEYFSSLTLARLLELLAKQRARLPQGGVWHIAHSLFAALAHAHGRSSPVVHTDVRPANIMIAPDGRVRLSGFGHARLGDAEESTACGHMGNGPSYVAPEQLRGQNLTERVDVFAAALIAWELLTGRCATPEGMADIELLRHFSQRQVEPLRALRPDLPPLVAAALDACLAANPLERTIQAEEVAGCIAATTDLRAGAEALRDAVGSLGVVWGGLMAVESMSRSAPPSSGQQRSPAFSVSIPAAPPVPGLVDDAEPQWDEVTQVPPGPKSAVVDLPRTSPSQVIQQASMPSSGQRRMPASLSPTTAQHSVEKQPSLPERGWGKWVMAVPVAMFAAVVTFALIGGWGRGAESEARKAEVHEHRPAVTSPAESLVPRSTAPTIESAAPPVAAPLPVVKSAPIPKDRAVLLVHSPPEGWVYVQGAPAGKTDEPIETSCGRRFVRVGTEMDERGMQGVRWLSEGKPLLLRCGQRHEVPLSPWSIGNRR